MQLGRTLLPHPPYNPDLVPSDFDLVGPLKHAVRGRKFESADDMISAVRTWSGQRDKEWYQSGICALIRCWRKAVELRGDFVENWDI